MKIRFFTISENGAIPAVIVNLRLRFEDSQVPDGIAREHLETISGKPENALILKLISEIGMMEHGLLVASTRTDMMGYGRIDIARLSESYRTTLLMLLAFGLANNKARLLLEIKDDPASTIDILDVRGLRALLYARLISNTELNVQTAAGLGAVLAELIGDFEDALYLQTDTAPEEATCGHIDDPDAIDYALSPGSFVSRQAIKSGTGGDCEHLTPASLPLRQYSMYHVAIYDNADSKDDRGRGKLPSVSGTPPLDQRILWGQILEFQQEWKSLGHSLGEVKYSLALAPGEAIKIAVIDWKRNDAGARYGTNASSDTLTHDQTVDRDIDDIVHGRVTEQQSGSTFMAGLAGAMDFQIPQYGISAAGRHSIGYGTSNTEGKRDVSADAHQGVHLETLQRSNLVRSQNSTVIIQATQAESNTLSARIVANMNRGHSLSILYYEVLRHLTVTTNFLRADTAVLVPVEMFAFDAELARRFRAQLEPVLLDEKYSAGFDALERLALGPINGGSSSVAPTPAPSSDSTPESSPIATSFEVTLVSEWRYSSILTSYVPPPDTAGAIQVVLELQNDTVVKLIDLKDRAPVLEQFGDINNWISHWPGWRVSFEEKDRKTGKWGRSIATFNFSSQSVDLRTIKRVLVKWKRVNTVIPFVSENDGWNLKKISIKTVAADGASYPLVDHSYSLSYGQKELFSPTNSDDFQINSQAPLLPIELIVPTTSNDNTSNTSSTSTPASPSDAEVALLLVNHLNANQYYYNAYAWLLMDPRERRQRISAYVGPLLAGMSDVPLTMTGNHLAFRYTGKNLPAAARAALPDSVAKLRPQRSIVTLPTRGIFAEAHMGHCNAAEKRDITRLWNFDELPVSLLPNIDSLTAGPRGSYQGITPDSMGASALGIQATPDLPAPGEAIAKALELLAKPDIFRDQSTREQVAEIMGKLIESAQPPKLSGAGIGSAWGGGQSNSTNPSNSTGNTKAVSSPDEWANPFPSRANDISDGQSFLAERYGNGRTTDETDRLRLAPELAQNLFDTGMTQGAVEDIIGKYTKGTTGKVSRTPTTKKLEKFPVALDSSTTLTGGATHALDGYVTLTFYPATNIDSQSPITLEFGVSEGVDSRQLSIPAGTYSVRAIYRPANTDNIKFIEEPQMGSIGVNLEILPRLIIDLMQQDLADEGGVSAPIRGTSVTIPSGCKGLRFNLELKMANNQYTSVHFEGGFAEGITIDASGSVGLDTTKLGELAQKVAGLIKVKQVALLSLLLSLFSLKGNIGADGKITSSSSGKAEFDFQAAFIQDFAIREVK